MKKLITLAVLFVSSMILFSCKTLKEVPEGKTSAQIIQMGQNYAAVSDYKSAELCYNTVIDRYGSDLKCYVEARYELAHSFYKQKRYDEAKTMFNEIVSIFDSPEAIYQVQPKYKKLAQIQLDKIAAIEAKAKK